jgi:MFS family permease
MSTALPCATCGEPNPAGARFCNACGRRLIPLAVPRDCPTCGETNPAAARFCNACGSTIPAAALPGRPPPSDEAPTLRRAAPPAPPPAPAAAPPDQSGARRLLWWTIPSDSILNSRSFQALMTMRVATETALNALTYGMLIVIVEKYGEHVVNGQTVPASRWVGLLAALVTISTIAPAALFGPVGGVVVDRLPKRLVLAVTNLVRALLCFAFLFIGSGTAAIYALLIAITIVTQFATPAESSVLPWVVPGDRLAAANSFANLSESAGQLLGIAILAPVMVTLPGAPESLILVCGVLLSYAAVRAVAIRLQPPQREAAPPPRRPPAADATAGKPWLTGSREALLEAWHWLAGDRAAFISMMLLVLASTANLVMVTLAPKFTEQVIGLSPKFAVFVFGPAVVGMLTGLALVPRLAHRFDKRLLVTVGFLLMVCVLLGFGMLDLVTALLRRFGPFDDLLGVGPLGHADGRLGTALILAIPLGFAFSMVQVAAQTLLHERVPLAMQGRVFALQGAVKNATAVVPLLALGGLASLVGDVRPVMIVAALLILSLALYGGARSAQWTGGPPPSRRLDPAAGEV